MTDELKLQEQQPEGFGNRIKIQVKKPVEMPADMPENPTPAKVPKKAQKRENPDPLPGISKVSRVLHSRGPKEGKMPDKQKTRKPQQKDITDALLRGTEDQLDKLIDKNTEGARKVADKMALVHDEAYGPIVKHVRRARRLPVIREVDMVLDLGAKADVAWRYGNKIADFLGSKFGGV